MMKLVLIPLLAVACGACGRSMASERPAPAALPASSSVTALASDAKVARVTIPVVGMACSKCAKNIERSLMRLDGVQSADVDFDKKLVAVVYDENKLTPARLVEEIKKLGFEPGAPVKG